MTVQRRVRTSSLQRPRTDRFFERLTLSAVARIPVEVRERLSEVVFTVEREPSWRQRRRAALGADESLYGLYEGVPLTERSATYGGMAPAKITIFRGPIERDYRTASEIARQIRVTVIHEVAHHFGIDEAHLSDMGLD